MPRSVPRAAAYTAVLVGGLAIVFVAPWHSPLAAAPALSDSYALGFDNRVAMFGALLMCAALVALGWSRRGGADGLVLAKAAPADQRVSLRLVVAALVLSAGSAVTFAWLALHSYGYGEKNYFLDRLGYLVAGFGPYRDVEFTYGPALIQLPAWAARALGPLGIGPAGAYTLVWIASYLAGVPLLAYCVDRLAMPRGRRNALFAALAVSVVFNETVGMNGLLVRFLLPAAALIALHGAASRIAASGASTGVRAALLAAAVAAAAAAGALVSPEVGIAVTAGAAAYLAWSARTDRAAVAGAAGLAVTPLLAWALMGPAAARHLVGMAGGALNFPVVPGAPVLVLLAGAAAAAALLPRHLGRDDAAAPAALALAVAGGVMLAGALGRADSSHAYFYGLTIALLAGAALASRAPRAFAAYAMAFAAVSLAAHLLVLGGDYGAGIVSITASRTTVPEPALRVVSAAVGIDPSVASAFRRRARPYTPPDVSGFSPYAPLAAPYGFRDAVGLGLAQRGWLAPAYFRGVPFTRAQLAQHLASLEPARHLVLPAAQAAALATPPVAPARPAVLGGKRYGVLLMWPERFEVKRPQPDIDAELRGWIAARYHRVAVVSGYTVFERKE